MTIPPPQRQGARAVIETYVVHPEGVGAGWYRDGSRWTWYCITGTCLEAEEMTEQNSAMTPLPSQQAALKSLARHQAEHHTCPTCGGCGYDVNFDGTDNGACLRCNGHGIWLGATS